MDEAALFARLTEPTYQNRLRMIGREIDRGGYEDFVIVEVNGGFLLCAAPPGGDREGVEFPDDSFPDIAREMIAQRGGGQLPRPSHPALLPTGAQDFLRALGFTLDERRAARVVLAELHDHVAIGGLMGIANEPGSGRVPFGQQLRMLDVKALLEAARGRRSALAADPARSRLFDRHG